MVFVDGFRAAVSSACDTALYLTPLSPGAHHIMVCKAQPGMKLADTTVICASVPSSLTLTICGEASEPLPSLRVLLPAHGTKVPQAATQRFFVWSAAPLHGMSMRCELRRQATR